MKLEYCFLRIYPDGYITFYKGGLGSGDGLTSHEVSLNMFYASVMDAYEAYDIEIPFKECSEAVDNWAKGRIYYLNNDPELENMFRSTDPEIYFLACKLFIDKNKKMLEEDFGTFHFLHKKN